MTNQYSVATAKHLSFIFLIFCKHLYHRKTLIHGSVVQEIFLQCVVYITDIILIMIIQCSFTHHMWDQFIISSGTTTGTGGNGHQGSVGEGVIHRARLRKHWETVYDYQYIMYMCSYDICTCTYIHYYMYIHTLLHVCTSIYVHYSKSKWLNIKKMMLSIHIDST